MAGRAVQGAAESGRLTPSRSRATRTTFLGSILIQSVNAGAGIVLARELGPADRGHLALIVLLAWFLVVVVSFGGFEAAAYYGALPGMSPGRVAGTVLVLALFQSVVAVTVGAAAVWLVLHGSGHHVLMLGFLFLVFVPINLAIQYLGALLRANGDFTSFNVARVAFTVGSAIAIAGAAATTDHLSIGAPLFAYVSVGALTVLYSFFKLTRGGMQWACDFRLAKQISVFGIKSATGSVSSLFNQQADQFVVGLFLGAAQLGLYVVAATVTSAIVLVGQSIALVALPTLAALHELSERRRAGRRVVLVTLVVSAGAAIVGIVLSPWLIPMLFGEPFRGSVASAQVLFVAAVFLSLNRSLAAVLRADNRPGVVGIAELTALVMTLILLAVLTPLLGILGAALASLVAYGTATLFMCVALRVAKPGHAPLVVDLGMST